MPRSKLPTKKQSASQRRKANNIRKAINKFENSPQQTALRQSSKPGDLDKAKSRFARVFPDWILKRVYKDV
mgnify:FL=1